MVIPRKSGNKINKGTIDFGITFFIHIPINMTRKIDGNAQAGSSIASENSLFGRRDKNIKNGPVKRNNNRMVKLKVFLKLTVIPINKSKIPITPILFLRRDKYILNESNKELFVPE